MKTPPAVGCELTSSSPHLTTFFCGAILGFCIAPAGMKDGHVGCQRLQRRPGECQGRISWGLWISRAMLTSCVRGWQEVTFVGDFSPVPFPTRAGTCCSLLCAALHGCVWHMHAGGKLNLCKHAEECFQSQRGEEGVTMPPGTQEHRGEMHRLKHGRCSP